jgi:hypothetical protein
MKKIKITALITGLASLVTAALMSGCVVRPYGGVAVEAPGPAVTVGVYPDYYVWDGYEYIGVVGNQYYYLGPGNVWVVCDRVRLARFHDWERYHPDWHAHAIHNVHYHQGYVRHDDRNSHHDNGHHDQDDEH